MLCRKIELKRSAMAFWQPFGSLAIYFAVAVMWIIPDSRIERAMRGTIPVAEE